MPLLQIVLIPIAFAAAFYGLFLINGHRTITSHVAFLESDSFNLSIFNVCKRKNIPCNKYELRGAQHSKTGDSIIFATGEIENSSDFSGFIFFENDSRYLIDNKGLITIEENRGVVVKEKIINYYLPPE